MTLDASAGPHSTEDVTVAQRLGRFVLLHPIGTGGMGSVFAAYDEQLDRKIALKLLHKSELAQGDQRQRVLREAQAMARISHPNVVQVYDVGEAAGRIFIAMEYIDGTTLGSWQKQQPQTWQEILQMYLQAGRGLLAAHRKGLVHRDFKPENVLIDRDGHARVADFGLARVQGDAVMDPHDASPGRAATSGPVTVAGVIAGTPGYMSPEQYRGDPVDGRSDQFSFCVALFEALFQCLPFAGDTMAELAANTLAGRRVRPSSGSAVPAEIRAALDCGLAVEPAARYPSMAELLAVLDGEAESNPAATRSARRRMFIGMFGVMATIVTVVEETLWGQELTIPTLIVLSIITLVIFLIAIVVARRSLTSTAFHRGIVGMTLITLTSWIGIRCLSLPLHLEMTQLIPLEMMALGGFWGALAYQYLPGLWWITGLMITGSIASVFRPQNSQQLLLTIYAAWPFISLYVWDRADGKRRAAAKALAPQSPDSAQGSSRPSS